VARISYVDVDKLDDAELREYMEHARRFGTPRPETQAIRSHVPAVARAFSPPGSGSFGMVCSNIRLRSSAASTVSQTIECNY